MSESLEAFLDRVAHRGSWLGGGSLAALTAGLSAALLEKLVVHPTTQQRLRQTRRDCLRLVEQDATAFAKVVEASRASNRRRFQKTLRHATAIQERVVKHARMVGSACRRAQRVVPVRLRSDLQCVRALAWASRESATALVRTNRTWLRRRAAR